jgi:hypothetical protein
LQRAYSRGLALRPHLRQRALAGRELELRRPHLGTCRVYLVTAAPPQRCHDVGQGVTLEVLDAVLTGIYRLLEPVERFLILGDLLRQGSATGIGALTLVNARGRSLDLR